MKEQSREHARENADGDDRASEQCPIPPRNTRWNAAEAPQHLRPEVARRFNIAKRGQRCPQQCAHLFHFALFVLVPVSIVHGLIPASWSLFLSRRTPRNMRTFTAFSEMPSAAAISLYGSSSTRPSSTTTRRR